MKASAPAGPDDRPKVPFAVKLVASYLLVVSLSSLGLGWLGLRYLQSTPVARKIEHAQTVTQMQGAMISAAPGILWSPLLPTQVQKVSEESGLQLWVFRGDGKLLVSPQNGEGHEASWDADEIFAFAQQDGDGNHAASTDEGWQSFEPIVQPIRVGADTIGFIVARFSLADIRAQQAELLWQFGAIFLGGSAVALLVALLLARTVTRPLEQIVRRCLAISNGDYDVPGETHSRDEIGLVHRTVEAMAARLIQQRTESERRRARLDELLALLQDAVLLIDTSRGVLTFANQRAQQLLLEGNARARGTALPDVFSAEILAQLQEALSSAPAPAREIIWKDDSGKERFGQLHTTPLEGSAEESEFLLVVHEVTDAHRFETLRREFASNVSHELKTPITAIGAILDALLEEGGADDPEARAYFLPRLRLQNERLFRLVQELLTLSKLENESDVLEFKQVDAGEVLAKAEETFHRVAEAREIALIFAPPAVPRALWADATALDVMLNSLIDNALRYTQKGGRVRVSVLPSEDSFACLRVEDNGPGIAIVDQNRVFERFYRVEGSRHREPGGSGLGLAIVKHLAEAHGGGIELTSSLGSGSQFSLRIPLVPHALEPEHVA